MKGRVLLHLFVAALVALAAAGAVGQNTFTLYDDGDYLYDGTRRISTGSAEEDIYYDMGGRGRPGTAGTPYVGPYSGQEYLTIWGDLQVTRARYASRISAFVASDVGLDHTQDWWVSCDAANDLLNTGLAFNLWLLPFKPDASLLNNGAYIVDNQRTFRFAMGHQVENDDTKGGIWIEALKKPELGHRVSITPFRLDPDPDVTAMRGGHNRVTAEWFAAAQAYRWTVSNVNGMYQVIQPAGELLESPTTTYIAAGTTDNAYWMAASWTIHEISYGQGRLAGAAPFFRVELAGSGSATVDSTPAADEDEYFGTLPLHGVAAGAGDASFVKSGTLTGSGWTVRGKCESATGATYCYQTMGAAWSGQPEPYSGTPATLMVQILKAADDTVSFSYVDTSGSVLTWNEAAKAWQSGTSVLDIGLDAGGDDEWWIAYDGANYWLSVTNGPQARTATVPASSVRGGGANCLFTAGRPWTTGWGAADFTISSLELLPYFMEPPLSTGPFIVELAGGATATVDGSPVSDGATYDGVGTFWAVGADGTADAAFIKTPPLGQHPWTVTFYFSSVLDPEYAFAAEIKDAAWSGQPGPFTAWPGNNKMMLRAEDAPDTGQITYWSLAGVPRWWEIVNNLHGVWVPYESMMEMSFIGYGLLVDSISMGYDGTNYYFTASNGSDRRSGSAPGNTPHDMRYKTGGSCVAIGDVYTNRDRCDFLISGARLLPYLDRTLFPYEAYQYTEPVVNSISEAKQIQSGRHVSLLGDDIVSLSQAGSRYYVQEADRSAGIAVISGTPSLALGTKRATLGVVCDWEGEKVIYDQVIYYETGRSITVGSAAPPKPLGVSGRSLGGGPLGLVKGVELGTGLNNLGLLVKSTGRITYIAPNYSYLLMDDGSGVADDPAGAGVKVLLPSGTPPQLRLQDYIAVTGAARPYSRADGRIGRAIMLRGWTDIAVLAGP